MGVLSDVRCTDVYTEKSTDADSDVAHIGIAAYSTNVTITHQAVVNLLQVDRCLTFIAILCRPIYVQPSSKDVKYY